MWTQTGTGRWNGVVSSKRATVLYFVLCSQFVIYDVILHIEEIGRRRDKRKDRRSSGIEMNILMSYNMKNVSKATRIFIPPVLPPQRKAPPPTRATTPTAAPTRSPSPRSRLSPSSYASAGSTWRRTYPSTPTHRCCSTPTPTSTPPSPTSAAW